MPPSSRTRIRVAVAGGLLLILGVLSFEQMRLRRQLLAPEPVVPAPRHVAHLVSVDSLSPGELESVEVPIPLRVRRGETLVDLFEQAGLERGEANRATYAVLEHMDPRSLRAGTELAVYRRADESLSRFVLPVKGRGEIHVSRGDDTWASEWRDYDVVIREHRVRGRLERDLSSAMEEAGAPYLLSNALADVLQWDLDFNRDLRRGDEFSVLFRGVWINGRFDRIESVEAVAYRNRGRWIEAYRFGEGPSYYDAEGRPLKRQFLKSPLPFTRVTSRFSHSRLHPVLKTRRPHYGVDYGAPTGTPIRVTASGTVTYRGRGKGEGNYLKVRHTNGYETLYLHLSRFHANACRGCRVTQGDLIGYVGATGLATAAHLDYRIKKKGRYMDPLTLRTEPAPPLSGEELEGFLLRRDELRAAIPGGELLIPTPQPVRPDLDVAP